MDSNAWLAPPPIGNQNEAAAQLCGAGFDSSYASKAGCDRIDANNQSCCESCRCTRLWSGTISTASTTMSETTPTPTSGFSGAIPDRSKLTGDWWDVRDTLFSRGFALDVSLTQFYQGVVAGGTARDFEYGGDLDYYLNFAGT